MSLSENTPITVSITSALVVLAFVIKQARDMGSYKTKLDDAICRIAKHDQDLQDISNRVTDTNIRFAQIETDLQWIKSTLVQINEKL